MSSASDLWDAIKGTSDADSRYSWTLLGQLTNPQRPGSSGSVPNDTKGLKACQDVIGDFQNKGIEFDPTVGTTDGDTRPSHLNIAIAGVIAKLQQRTGQHEWAWKRHQEYTEELEKLRLVTANDRVVPSSDSGITTSEDSPDGLEVRPDMDREHFELQRPNPPLPGRSISDPASPR